ncbi:MAG TPA: ABC transporter permease [Opitutales bacterium]|nr:ABC transporter permease [Opitutales bacterium]
MAKLIIEAGRANRNYWRDLWRFRELFFFLSWRDVLVRYRQTAIGFAWAILRPLLTMLVLTVVFGRVAKLPSAGVPYAILVFSAMLPWQFFANSLSESSSSLVTNSNLITKIYFPRLIIPASSVIVGMIEFLVSFLILGGLMAWYHFIPTWRIVFLPLFVVLAFLTALGPGLIATVLNVRYRDFRYIIPFVVQFGLYISPVGFSSSVISEKFSDSVRLLYSLNPMVGVIDGFRWAICGDSQPIYGPGFLLSVGLSVLLLVAGLKYFRRMERKFADII